MRLNENCKLVGSFAVLVPYEKEHVPKYHDWMEDEELRRLTGSERLTLEQEFEMQRSWREDDDKLTFIVLSKDLLEKGADEVASMVGDVNLFIDCAEKSAEAEVMIAESSARGKGIALEALQLIISYAMEQLGIERFFVKITDDNSASLHLFENKLGFERVSHSEVFGEYTLQLPDDKLDAFSEYIKKVEMLSYR